MRCNHDIFALKINKCLQICIALINQHDLNLQTQIKSEGCENVVKLIVIFCLSTKKKLIFLGNSILNL